jgi:hypothetical protein
VGKPLFDTNKETMQVASESPVAAGVFEAEAVLTL